MGKDWAKLNNRNLLVILVSLCAVVVILVCLIVINATKVSNEKIETNDEIEEVVVIDENKGIQEDVEKIEEGYDFTDEDIRIDNMLTEKYEDVKEKVQQLLEQNPVNVAQINELYNGLIQISIASNRLDYAVAAISERTEDLLSKNLKQEALDVLLNTDLSVYAETDRYRLYTSVIDLAKELGNNEVVTKYKALRDTVKDAYLEDCNSTLKAAIEEGDYNEEDIQSCKEDE